MPVHLTHSAIDTAAVLESITDDDAGAVVLFLGTVRRMTGEEETIALEYQAAESLATKTMAELETDALSRWPIRQMAIVHRLGQLKVGEISVAVAIACPHRKEAFAAAEYVMDRLKAIVPIWKQDIAVDGATQWIHPQT
jgi:molybdopterin synthase catalytic subunit